MTDVLLVEDRPDMAEWMRGVVMEAMPEAVITLADTLRQARTQLPAQEWSLLLADIGLPDGSGLNLVKEARQLKPALPVVVVTVFDDDDNLFAALKAGASGYLIKSQPRELLVQQLMLMRTGQPPLSPSMARRLLEHFHAQGQADDAVALTQREREILAAIARGMRNREVAEALHLSPLTVATYIRDLYTKLDISNRAQAVREAQKRGLG